MEEIRFDDIDAITARISDEFGAWSQVSPDELRCDLPVEFVFRKIHEAGGKPNYFWKCTPRRTAGGHVEGTAAHAAEGDAE